MEKFTRSHKIHPVGLRAWTVEETKIPHRPNSAIPPPRRAVQRTVNQAYMQHLNEPIETAREEDMEPTVMEAPQTRKVPRRVTKRENINLVRECEWDVKDIKDDSPGKRTTLSKRLVFLLGAVCVTSCVSLMLTLLILFGSIEAGNCSCGDSKGLGSTSAMKSDDDDRIEKFSENITTLGKRMEEVKQRNDDRDKHISLLRQRIQTLKRMLSEHNATKLQLHEKTTSQESILKNLTKRLESTQAQLGGKVAELRELKMSTTRQLTELRKLWAAVNTTKQEKDNLTDKVEQEFKNIRRDVKETKQSLLNKTDSSLQDFEKKVNSKMKRVLFKLNKTRTYYNDLSSSLDSLRKNATNRSQRLEVRIKIEEEKSNHTEKVVEHHFKKIQYMENLLNVTQEEISNMSREHSTALRLAKNSTDEELHRVWTKVNLTQINLLQQLKKVQDDLTELVTNSSEGLEARMEIEAKKSNNTRQVVELNLKRIQHLEDLLNITRDVIKEVSRRHFSALWLTGNSTNKEFHRVWTSINLTQSNILEKLKKAEDNLTERVNNVSKMPGPIGPPGHNGSQGAAGPAGSTGPPGPKGAGNFSVCQYNVVKDVVAPGGQNKATVGRTEPTGKRILGTTCSTNYAAEYNLLSQQEADGRWRYACSCRGASTLLTIGRDKNCYMHYWECPLTT